MKRVKAIRDAPIADAVEKLLSAEQFVRGGVSSPSRAQSWKWYVVLGDSPVTGSETGCGSSSSISTLRTGVVCP